MPGDARELAEAIVRQLDRSTPFLCYGTADQALVALGRRAALTVPDALTLDSVWQSVDRFIRTHEGAPIVGFIGFDPSDHMGFNAPDTHRKLDLFVPQSLLACSRQGWALQFGEDVRITLPSPVAQPPRRPLSPAQFDSESNRRKYREAVARVLERIHNGSMERATLARRVEVDRPLDLGLTFLSEGSAHRCSRNFYFANECIRFAGQSPEVLAEGHAGRFTTNKLSGTARRDAAVPEQVMQQRFQTDERIRAEHASSIQAVDKSLRSLGRVEVERFKLMQLPGLLHGWSEFTTWPRQSGNIAACLRAVFPFGVSPMAEGLQLLREHEDFQRGPYYGLVGCIEPDSRFSFTQVLRSAFADDRGCYLVAGAAITVLSTPELEMEETCNKLSSIKIYEALGE